MGTAILRSSEILCSAQKGRFLFKQGRRCCFRQSPGDTTMAFALGCVTRKQVYSFYAGSRLYLPEPFDPGPVKRLLVTVGMGYPFKKSAFHRHVLLASGGGIGQDLPVIGKVGKDPDPVADDVETVLVFFVIRHDAVLHGTPFSQHLEFAAEMVIIHLLKLSRDIQGTQEGFDKDYSVISISQIHDNR